MKAAVINEIRSGLYLDSVSLMRISRTIARLEGVEEAALMMASPSNRQIMANAGLLNSSSDGAGGGDEADEQADPDQHLEAEGDKAHAGAADHGEHGTQREAHHRDDQHQRLIAGIGEDHRDEAEGIDRLGKAVIGVEARLQRQGGGGNRDRRQAGEGAGKALHRLSPISGCDWRRHRPHRARPGRAGG